MMMMMIIIKMLLILILNIILILLIMIISELFTSQEIVSHRVWMSLTAFGSGRNVTVVS